MLVPEIQKTSLDEISGLRKEFLAGFPFQFTYDKCHLYGWSDDYLITWKGEKIGYGCLWGDQRDSLFEFYVVEPYRRFANDLFSELLKVSKAATIECQSNDILITTMLYEYAKDIHAEAILFKDNSPTHFEMPDVALERNFPESNDRNIQYFLKDNGVVVANGGFITNYNFPYIDVYYEVLEEHRQKGYATFFIQELKKEAYRMERVPAARCNVKNPISKRALLKAGMVVCGNRLQGTL